MKGQFEIKQYPQQIPVTSRNEIDGNLYSNGINTHRKYI